jgi:hypothetical protein
MRYLTIWLVLLIAGGTLAQNEAGFSIPRLSPDIAMTGTVAGGVSTQLYSLRGNAEESVTVTMSADDNDLDGFLILLDANGTVIAYNDDAHADTLDAAIESVALPSTGDYLIMATTFENLDEFLSLSLPDPQNYTLQATGFTDEAPSPLQLTTVPIGYGETVTVESTAEQPVHYLTFEGRAGDTVDVVARRVQGIDPMLHIFGPDGARVAFDDDDDTSPTFTVDAAVYGLEIPVTGRYLVLAMDTFFYNAPTPDAALRYSPGVLTVEVRPLLQPDLP